MFEKQLKRDSRSKLTGGDPGPFAKVEQLSPGFSEFMLDNGGCSYDGGLYRVLPLSRIDCWNSLVCEAFPQYTGKIVCFGFDWLGRCFALDATRHRDGQLLVMLLEPGTGKPLKAPVTFSEFHNVELVEYKNDSLASDFFSEWLQNGGEEPEMDECVGYKKPLFLGGEDTVDNLEKSDLEVYWSICSQLLTKVRLIVLVGLAIVLMPLATSQTVVAQQLEVRCVKDAIVQVQTDQGMSLLIQPSSESKVPEEFQAPGSCSRRRYTLTIDGSTLVQAEGRLLGTSITASA